jgi:hypothetical protein
VRRKSHAAFLGDGARGNASPVTRRAQREIYIEEQMAIYHLNVKTISRAKGHSAVASIAYRRAEHMHDARYEKIYDDLITGGSKNYLVT